LQEKKGYSSEESQDHYLPRQEEVNKPPAKNQN